MGDSTLTTALGRVLATGGAGFVGTNLVAELLDRGHQVRSFDRAPSPLSEHPRLQTLPGDVTNVDDVAAAVAGIDAVFHTAAIIDLMGGGSASALERSFAVNVDGTENLVHAAKAARQRGDVDAERAEAVRVHRVQQRGDGRPADRRWRRNPALHTTIQRSVHRNEGRGREVRASRERGRRPVDLLDPAQRHLGPRRPDHVPSGVRERARRARQGSGRQQARETRQHLRAQPHSRFHPGRRAPGSRRHCTRPGVLRQRRRADPHVRVRPSGPRGLRAAIPEDPGVGMARPPVVSAWQWLHFRFGLPKPPLEPLAVERLYLDNYFSVAKARRDLGYRPLFTTEQAMADCVPYYTDLYAEMKAAGQPAATPIYSPPSARA